jgi:hypothetical protein
LPLTRLRGERAERAARDRRPRLAKPSRALPRDAVARQDHLSTHQGGLYDRLFIEPIDEAQAKILIWSAEAKMNCKDYYDRLYQ